MKVNFLQIIENIKKIKGLKSDTEVATAIGMKIAALSAHKSRGSIPYEALFTFCKKEGISIDQLFNVAIKEERVPEKEVVPCPPEGTRPPDLDLLKEVIETVEEIFQKKQLHLPPPKKAELIVLIYEEMAEDRSKLRAMPDRVLKLVKLAS